MTNFVSIVLSASVVFVLVGIAPIGQLVVAIATRAWLVTFAAGALILTVPLALAFQSSYVGSTEEIAAGDAVRAWLPPDQGYQIVSVRVQGDTVDVQLAGPLDPADLAALDRDVDAALGRDVATQVRVFAAVAYPARPPRDADPVRASADRVPAPRPRRQRGLGLGTGGPRRWPGAPAHRGPRPDPLPARVRRGDPRGPRLARVRGRPRAGPPERLRRALPGGPGGAPSGRPCLRLRLHPGDLPDLGRDPRPALRRPGLPERMPRPGRAGRHDTCGDRRRVGGVEDRLAGACAGAVAAGGDPSSATGMAAGATASRWSSTTCARASISSCAVATCSTPRRTRSGSAGSSAGRRRRGSPTMPSSFDRTARSCPRPTAIPAYETSARRVGPRRTHR